jgi:PilZ domain
MSRIPDSRKGETGGDHSPRLHPQEHSQVDDINRRDAKRSTHQVPVLVSGSDVDEQAFLENSATLNASDGGCLLPLANAVVQGQRLLLVNMRNQDQRECRVVRVGKGVRGKTVVGVEFLCPAPEFWHDS